MTAQVCSIVMFGVVCGWSFSAWSTSRC